MKSKGSPFLLAKQMDKRLASGRHLRRAAEKIARKQMEKQK